MLTIRAYFPAALPTNGVSPPPPPPPPPPPGTVRPLDFDIDTLPLHPLEEIPQYHPSYYGFPYPLPPRVDRLPPERNRIQFPYWGLTRYAVGHVIVSQEEWYNLKTTSSWDGSVQVTYDDGAGGTDTIYMRVVSAAPVSDSRVVPTGTPANTTDPIEWRLTVVDQRYEWNERVFAGSGGVYATWGATISALILQATGQTITDTTINALLPAPLNAAAPNTAWTATRMNGQSVCALADAACAAVCLRIAVGKDGVVEVQNPSSASTALSTYTTAIVGEVSYGGKVATTEVPALIRCLEYNDTGLLSNATVAYPAAALPTRGEVMVTLPYTTGAGLAEFATRMSDWQTPDVWDATFAGFIPLTKCSMCGTFVLDHDAGVSRIVADPNRYPWPLASPLSLLSPGTSPPPPPASDNLTFLALPIAESGSPTTGYTYTLRRLTPYLTTGTAGSTAVANGHFTDAFTVAGCREVQNRRVLTVTDPGVGVLVPPWTGGGPSPTPRYDYPIVRVTRVIVEAGATDNAYYQFSLDQPADDTRAGHVTPEDQIWDGRKTDVKGFYAARDKQTFRAESGGTLALPVAALDHESSPAESVRAGVFGKVTGGLTVGAADTQVAQMTNITSVVTPPNLIADPASTVLSGSGTIANSGSISGYLGYPAWAAEVVGGTVTLVSGATANYALWSLVTPGQVTLGTISTLGTVVSAALVSNGPFGWEGMSAGGIGTGPTLVLKGGLTYLSLSMNYWSPSTYTFLGGGAPIEGSVGSGSQFVCTDDLVLAHGKTTGAARRYGVRRGGSVAWGADLNFAVLTYYGTTLITRSTLFARGGLVCAAQYESPSPPSPPPPGGGTATLRVAGRYKDGTPAVGRTIVVTGPGAGTYSLNLSGEYTATGLAAGAGTCTVTLLGEESCVSQSFTPDGDRRLSNANTISYTLVAGQTTDVQHEITSGAVRMSATTGDLTVWIGDVPAVTNLAVRTPDRSASAILPGTANDYGLPANFKGRTVYLTSSGAVTITGFDATGVADGTTVRVVLRSTSSTITVNHNDAGSSAANRVLITGGAAATYGADDGFEMEYDATDSRWRIWR